MDEIVNSTIYENSAYLATKHGNVYRVWFEDDGQPLIERLLPKNAREVTVWMDKVFFISKKL